MNNLFHMFRSFGSEIVQKNNFGSTLVPVQKFKLFHLSDDSLLCYFSVHDSHYFLQLNYFAHIQWMCTTHVVQHPTLVSNCVMTDENYRLDLATAWLLSLILTLAPTLDLQCYSLWYTCQMIDLLHYCLPYPHPKLFFILENGTNTIKCCFGSLTSLKSIDWSFIWTQELYSKGSVLSPWSISRIGTWQWRSLQMQVEVNRIL